MKKSLAIVLSLILALCMAVPASAAVANTPTHTADLKGKVDVLDGLTSVQIVSPNLVLSSGQFGTYTDCVSGEKKPISFTDGIICANVGSSSSGGSVVYVNKKTYADNAAARAAESDGIRNYTFDTATGSTAGYYYYIEVSEINNAKVDEFACYFTTNIAKSANDYVFPFAQADSSFDILVSCDGGKTYEVAWSSVEFKMDENAPASSCVLQAACMSKESGKGNATIVTETGGPDAVGGTLYTYAVINEKLNKTYENVTNVVYAVTGLRRTDMATQDLAQCYLCRMSEFDLYQAEEPQPNPGTADTTVYYVAATAVIVAGAVLTVCKKRKEN